jgi:hypothetical protein
LLSISSGSSRLRIRACQSIAGSKFGRQRAQSEKLGFMKLSVAVAPDEYLQHGVSIGIDEPDGRGVDAHEPTFDKCDVFAAIRANVPLQTLVALKIEETACMLAAR